MRQLHFWEVKFCYLEKLKNGANLKQIKNEIQAFVNSHWVNSYGVVVNKKEKTLRICL